MERATGIEPAFSAWEAQDHLGATHGKAPIKDGIIRTPGPGESGLGSSRAGVRGVRVVQAQVPYASARCRMAVTLTVFDASSIR